MFTLDEVDSGELAVDPSPRVPEDSRRGRKKQDTRNRLVAAADDLFDRQGYDETTTLDIAEAADVAQRTLFRHFPSKEALLYAELDDARFVLRDALHTQPDDVPALTAIRAAMAELGNRIVANRERRLLEARLAATTPAVSGYFRAVVQAGWERELIVAVAERLDVDPMQDPRPEVLAGAAMSACRIATRQWTVSEGTADYVALADRALEAIADLADLA
jgi:AcrR family transcriptional regulator